MPSPKSKSPAMQTNPTTGARSGAMSIEDNRPAQRKALQLKQIMQNNPQVQQAKALQARMNQGHAVTQLRGKTKYGAMMGNARQGPHIIAHGTLEAVEGILDQDPVTQYKEWLEIGIIMKPDQLWEIITEEREGVYDENDVILGRYRNYYNEYKKSFDIATEYFNALTKKQLKQVDKETSRDELSLYLNDLRDMHPDSTYGSNILLKGEEIIPTSPEEAKGQHEKRKKFEKKWMAGKGERRIDNINSAISDILNQVEMDNDIMLDLLVEEIMRDADTENLGDDTGVKALAAKWATLLLKKRKREDEQPSKKKKVEAIELDDDTLF